MIFLRILFVFFLVTPALGKGMRTSEYCGSCHDAIYKEWKKSYHAQAYTNPLFKAATSNYTKTECLPCHSPKPISETGYVNQPQTRTELPEEGVSCLSCHAMGEKVMGPIKGIRAECNPVFSEAIGKSDMCGVCHREEFREYSKHRFSEKGTVCQSCHMEEDLRPIVKNGADRKSRLHNWPGGHNEVFLETHVKDIQFDIVGDTFLVLFDNQKIGHSFPTATASNPALIFMAIVKTPDGIVKKAYRKEHVKTRTENEAVIHFGEKLRLSYFMPIKAGQVIFMILYKRHKTMLDQEAAVIFSKTITFKN